MSGPENPKPDVSRTDRLLFGIYNNHIGSLYSRSNVKTYDPRVIRFQNKTSVNKKFIFGEKIGQGAFSQVHAAKYDGAFLKTQSIFNQNLDPQNQAAATAPQERARGYALKEMERDKYIKAMIAHQTISEIMLLRKLNHPNIEAAQDIHYNHHLNDLSTFDSDKKNVKMYLQMEKARHDLMALAPDNETKKHLFPAQIKCIMVQICSGLIYLHAEKKIVHRDIKPPNILWHEDGTIKITDFNHATDMNNLVESNYKGICGTPWFKAPELIMEMAYSYNLDVWALGCVFAYLLNPRPARYIFSWDTNQPKQLKNDRVHMQKVQLKPIFDILGYPTENSWPEIEASEAIRQLQGNKHTSSLREYLQNENITDPEAIDLLEKMLVCNPKNRISVQEVIQHSYLSAPCEPRELPRLLTEAEWAEKKRVLAEKEKERQAQVAAAAAAAAAAKQFQPLQTGGKRPFNQMAHAHDYPVENQPKKLWQQNQNRGQKAQNQNTKKNSKLQNKGPQNDQREFVDKKQNNYNNKNNSRTKNKNKKDPSFYEKRQSATKNKNDFREKEQPLRIQKVPFAALAAEPVQDLIITGLGMHKSQSMSNPSPIPNFNKRGAISKAQQVHFLPNSDDEFGKNSNGQTSSAKKRKMSFNQNYKSYGKDRRLSHFQYSRKRLQSFTPGEKKSKSGSSGEWEYRPKRPYSVKNASQVTAKNEEQYFDKSLINYQNTSSQNVQKTSNSQIQQHDFEFDREDLPYQSPLKIQRQSTSQKKITNNVFAIAPVTGPKIE